MSVIFKNPVYFRIYSIIARDVWSDATCISEMFGFSNCGQDTNCTEFACGFADDFRDNLRDST